MKNLFTCFVAFFAFSFICPAQDKGRQPTINKHKNGTISSVEFSGKEENIPASAKAFFADYLKAKPSDQFKMCHINRNGRM